MTKLQKIEWLRRSCVRLENRCWDIADVPEKYFKKDLFKKLDTLSDMYYTKLWDLEHTE